MKKEHGSTVWRLRAFFCGLRRREPPCTRLSSTFVRLFHGLFVGLDHFLNHLAAYGTGLLRSQVAVVALLQIYAHFSVRMFTY